MLSRQRLTALTAVVFGYIVKFMAYGFLTPVVLMTFAALVFVYITLAGPELPFLQYLSFMLPIDGRGNASIDGNDIMNAFGLLTMTFFVLSLIGGWLIRILKRVAKRVFEPGSEVDGGNIFSNQNPLASIKRRLIVSSIVITIIYLVLFAVIPLARMAEGTSFLAMYPLFVVFYIVIMVANAIYIGIDTLSDIVLGWAWSKVISG
jgi:hypothetical protein